MKKEINDCLELKQHYDSYQGKTGKYKCGEMIATLRLLCCTRAYLCPLDEGFPLRYFDPKQMFRVSSFNVCLQIFSNIFSKLICDVFISYLNNCHLSDQPTQQTRSKSCETFYLLNNERFADYHNKMQETRNNCFRSKKDNITLVQMKIDKHKRRKITATYFKT